MAKGILGDAALRCDELNPPWVLDPEVTQQTAGLKEECEHLVDKIGQFQEIVGGLTELVDQLAEEAENEKKMEPSVLGTCSNL